MARSWYEIKNAAAAEADIYLYDEIGYWGVTAQSFVDALQAVKAKTINLFVNSPGGSVDDGMAIYNALKRHPAAVNATVDGLAASSASFIVQAAEKIAMGKGSTMMIHEPQGMAYGDAATMAKMIETLDVYGENIASVYAARAGGTADMWREKMRDETWYKAQDAVDAGLADELVGAAPSNLSGKVFNLSKFKHVPAEIPHVTSEMSVCTAPGCDQPAVIEMSLCKDCSAMVMGQDMTDIVSFDLSVLRESAVLAPPSPSMESLLKKNPLTLEPVGGK